MKGLALNTIGVLVIAMVSVLLLLSLVSGTLKDAANWLYCKVYIKLLGFFQGQELGSIPEVCKIFYLKNQAKEVEIKEGDNTIFSRKLLALIIACWKEAEIKGLYEDHPCYQIRIKTRVEDVTEKNVSDILINEDHCTSIENSDYGCGYYNQILWKVDGAVNWLTKDEIASLINSNVLPSPSP
ncbi:MAG: hypothetical protein J7K98_03685, partial [Candidatus Aenigmarchaeota archaeon]|nr:hypothetical protein [Candidatus Aenigmarchaeota archaeon]